MTTNQDNKNFGRMAVWFGVTKMKKVMTTYFIQIGIHLFLLCIIMTILNMLFPNFGIEDELFFKYLVASTKFLSTTATIEFNGKVYFASKFIEHYNFDVFMFVLKFTFISLAVYLPAGFILNKQINKAIKKIGKHYDTKLLSGTTILEDDEFIDKYNSLGMNDRSGIFISDIYKLTEVTEDDKDTRSN